MQRQTGNPAGMDCTASHLNAEQRGVKVGHPSLYWGIDLLRFIDTEGKE